mgnify:FL=1
MPKRLVIDLLRHGACSDGKIYRGRTDSALSALGWAQMQAQIQQQVSAGNEPSWQAIYSSTLQRCQLPAQQLAERLELPLRLDPRLREIDFGDWDGQLQQQVWQQYPAQVLAFWQNPETAPPPAGESIQDFQRRVVELLQQWLLDGSSQVEQAIQVGELMPADTPAVVDAGEEIPCARLLCVTHAGVIRALLCQLLGLSTVAAQRMSIDYGSLTRIELYPDDRDVASIEKLNSQVVFVNRVC